jgi:Protein of unknown function (DUF3168)
MTVSTEIFTALQASVGGRCYPDTFMQPDGNLPIWPAIRYTVIGGETYGDICGTGDGSTDTARVQIDIVASTHANRETVLNSVRTAMMNMTTPTTLQSSPRNEYESETKTYRAVLDYYVHS